MNESRELKKKNEKQRKIFISDKRSGARLRRFAKHSFENGRKGTFEARIRFGRKRTEILRQFQHCTNNASGKIQVDGA